MISVLFSQNQAIWAPSRDLISNIELEVKASASQWIFVHEIGGNRFISVNCGQICAVDKLYSLRRQRLPYCIYQKHSTY